MTCPPWMPGPGAEVDHVVGGLDHVAVVLHHDDRIAKVAQAFEALDEAVIVARVQADGRLVEDVEDAGQLRAHLRGEADPLALAPAEGTGRAVEREVAHAHPDEEVEPLPHLLHDRFSDARLSLGVERDVLHKLAEPRQVHLREVRDRLVADAVVKAFRLEAPAPAVRGSPFPA
jgi:hypothetical protein